MWISIAVAVLVVVVGALLMVATQRGWFGFRRPAPLRLTDLLQYLYTTDVPFQHRRSILHPFLQELSPQRPMNSPPKRRPPQYRDTQVPYNDTDRFHGGARAAQPVQPAWGDDEDYDDEYEDARAPVNSNGGIPITVHSESEDANIVSGDSNTPTSETV